MVRSLRAISQVVKPKGYGINRVGRHRSLPNSRAAAKALAKTFVEDANPDSRGAGTSVPKPGSLETVSEEVGDPYSLATLSDLPMTQQHLNSNTMSTTQADEETLQNHLINGLQAVPEATEQDS